ncbi:hypothetical protein [Pontibacter virosus]|uniref:Uncharacterized protein n=1 Tax=Pontibacter virosus TaxID=1765052 RepID=A0A2U1ALI2_9BACT|nr:hypothetical protein [Pontibacter virosus]PVY37161.1 hypothetical protein C8E01_12335 [Pontibacter virosus]
MKKTIKFAFAAFAFFAFTACGIDNNTATENDRIDEVETSDIDVDADMDMETDTTSVMDTTVNDGVADEIPEERPIQ